jgi:hypothetical protein
VVSITPRPRFAPGNGPPVPIVQEAGRAAEPVWTQGLGEESFASARSRIRVREIHFIQNQSTCKYLRIIRCCVCSSLRGRQAPRTASCHFNPGIIFTLPLVLLIYEIIQSCILPFVIKNCSREWHVFDFRLRSKIKTKAKNRLEAGVCKAVLCYSHKKVLLKVVHHLKIYQRTKFNCSTLTGTSIASNSRGMNDRHFWMVEATGLKSMTTRSPSMACFPVNWFNSYYSRADRQHGDLISLTLLVNPLKPKLV